LTAPHSDPSNKSDPSFRLGVASAITAYAMWGLFPIYWRWLGHVDALELVWHRILWSFVLLSLLLPILIAGGGIGGTQGFRQAITNPRTWLVYGSAAVMISVNWFVFIWAVNQNRVLEASLGYFISPLLNVLFGVLILNERLSAIQWRAIALAALGVMILSIANGSIPWVAFALAASFSIYGLIKKRTPLPPLVGLWMELTTLVIPAMIVLGMKTLDGTGAMNDSTTITKMLLIAGGVVTVVPLVLFAHSINNVDLSLIGILQYVGPTLQFIVGVFFFGEPLSPDRLLGFALIWAAVLTFVWSTSRFKLGKQNQWRL
jgi:chloramphenicol-sensitive protein RarD